MIGSGGGTPCLFGNHGDVTLVSVLDSFGAKLGKADAFDHAILHLLARARKPSKTTNFEHNIL